MTKGSGSSGSARILGMAIAGALLAGASTRADDALISAVQDGLLARVKALVAEHVNVNATDGNGATALAWAVMRENTELAAVLLKAHADPDIADVNGMTPLSVAVDNDSAPMIKVLLENGANPNRARGHGETPLMVAVHNNSAEIVRLLLEHKADPNARDDQFGQTALMWATGNPELVRLLLAHSADVKPATRTWEITSPIYTPPTATLGVTGIAWNNEGEFTTKAGGLNALMFAVQNDNIDSVRLLLDAGMDVNQAAYDGTTPLLAALYNWQASGEGGRGGMRFSANLKIAALLLDRGAKAKVTNGSGYTPLHGLVLSMVAPAGGGRGRRGATTSRTVDETEALHLAKRMLDMGADPNGATVYPTAGPVGAVRINPLPPGSTPYHAAGAVTSAALIDLLAEFGANPNIVRKDGHTPFSVGVMADNLTAVQAMAAHGADLRIIYNPADKIADPVESRAEVRRNQNAVHIAAAAGSSRVVDFLAAQGIPLDAKNDHGETPLQLAGDQEVFRYKRSLEGAHGIGDPNTVRSTATSDAIRKAIDAVSAGLKR